MYLVVDSFINFNKFSIWKFITIVKYQKWKYLKQERTNWKRNCLK